MSSAIRVALRICPELDDRESGSGSVQRSITLTNGNTVTLHRQKDGTITDGGSPGVQSSNLVVTHQYTFDKVFPEYTTQEEVFSSVRDLVQESLRGFNVTIFAFGMTGSGKTYTISGEREATGYSSHEVNTGFRPRSQSSGIVTGMGTIAGSNTASIDPSKAGIVPRTVYHVFSELRREATEHCDSIAMVFLTFVELYNNTFYDLLASDVPTDYNGSSSSGHGGNSGLGGLKLHDHPTRGMQLSGSATLRTPVASAEEALALIQRGYKLRATAATNLNERSSRSHTVLSLEVVISGRQEVSTGVTESGPGASGGNVAKDAGSTASVTRYGKINLVDLAGSERVKQSGAEGQTLEEAKQINKALSVLGDVLNSLSKRETDKDRRRTKHGVSATGTTLVGGGGSHIPYRNSKLTMLLKDSLGGNAKTMMIATIRTSPLFYQQTLTSLQYAARARHIRCNPIQNVAVGLGAGGGSASGDDEGGVQLHLKEVLRLRSRLEERTREFNELKLRLEHLEDERKARNRTQTMSSNSASTGGQAKPGDGHAAAAETALVEQYQRQIDQLQLRNEAEHKQLQEKMRYIIHSHEGTLAIKEKAYSTLEQELQYAQSRATALIQEKDRAVYSQHELERLNRQLRQENQQLKASLHASNTRLSDVERLLGSERDKAAAAAMSEADREQFVGALQKLTASRAKHKQRADKLQEELQTLIQQNGELSAKQVETKKQLLEQEVLLKSAVERIKMLCPIVGATAKSDDPQSPSPAAVLEAEAKAAAAAAKSDSAAASASAILIASTEMSAREQAMLKQELQEVLEQRNEARMQLDALKMVHATTAIERDQTIERMQAQERENTMQVTQHAQAHAQTEALLRAQLESLSGSLTQLQEEYEVHKAQAHEMRMQAEALLQEKEQDRLQLLHRLNESQGESLRMGEANQSLRVQLEEQVAQCDVLRSELLISQEQQQPDADEAMPASVLGSEMDTAASGGASPRSMNRSLRATISQLQEAELGLFRTMEEKLRDLDAARTKLHRLKSFNEQRGSPLRSPSPPSPVSVSALERAAEVLRVNLRQSEQKAESRYVELLAARQQVTELHIRLEASRTALAKEQDHSQALLQSMEQQREDHIDEIERMTALVRDRVASRQGARRSEDTSVSWPEDEAQGKLGDSSAPLDSEQQEERGHLPDWVDEEENMLTEKLFDDEEDTVCSDDFVFASGPPTAF